MRAILKKLLRIQSPSKEAERAGSEIRARLMMALEGEGLTMADTCKNCANASPTYKGVWCNRKDKKVKSSGTCESYRRKN